MTPSDVDPIAVAVAVGDALDAVGVPYFLGGSLASSLQGEPRATNDIDIVVDLQEIQTETFAAALGGDFDVDVDALRDAVRRRSSWNVFHLPSMTKIDLFILRPDPFDQSEMSRRKCYELAPGQRLVVKSPEDTVLRKLLWYKAAAGISSTQWRDIVEVLRVSGPQLDSSYMEGWAERLGTVDLLRRARVEAALEP